MKELVDQLEVCKKLIDKRFQSGWNYLTDDGSDLYAAAYKLSSLLVKEYSTYKERLDKHILPNFRVNAPFAGIGTSPYLLSQVALGELISTVAYLLNDINSTNEGIDWHVIHPRIIEVSRMRFMSGQYADAVEAAFKYINVTVKTIYYNAAGEELDGTQLMHSAFKLDNPTIKLNDLVTRSDKDEQLGYQYLFAGSISGIRNPQAHDVAELSRADAIRKLHFASMLMYKLDERL